MNLCIISDRENVGTEVPILGMLFNIVAEPCNNGVFIPLILTISLRVVRRREDVLNLRDLVNMLDEN